jgi:hypothetical protein
MVLYAYVLCLCILASSRIPRYYLGRQTPIFQGGFCHIQPEQHLSIAKDSKWSDKRCFFFIINDEVDLMMAQIDIQK